MEVAHLNEHRLPQPSWQCNSRKLGKASVDASVDKKQMLQEMARGTYQLADCARACFRLRSYKEAAEQRVFDTLGSAGRGDQKKVRRAMNGIVARRIVHAIEQGLTIPGQPILPCRLLKPESRLIACFLVIDLRRSEYFSLESRGGKSPTPALLNVKSVLTRKTGKLVDAPRCQETHAAGRVREATGTAQNLYGQATDAAREATDAAFGYAKDAYDSSGDTFRDGSQAIAKKVQDNPPGPILIASGISFALAQLMTRPLRRPPQRWRY
jgi:uncharacterized protein YjbJ (UPF0337 family)